MGKKEPLKPSAKFIEAVKQRWGKREWLTDAVRDEFFHHGDALGIGQDSDDQVSDGVMVGAFVGYHSAKCAGPDEFITVVEEIFLNKRKMEEWWTGRPSLEDDEDEDDESEE